MAERFDPSAVTWAALLGRWVEFARSAVALPTDQVGRKIRDSVPDVIMLQAVWFALQHLDELPPDERALGLDRAALLIDKHAGALESRWSDGEPMPEALRDIIHDARTQLDAMR